MKIKAFVFTLLILTLSVVLVSCGNADGSGSAQSSDDPTVKTTVTTTAATTTKESFDELYKLAPPKLPDGSSYEIVDRLVFNRFSGKYEENDRSVYNPKIFESGGLYKGGLKFSSPNNSNLTSFNWKPSRDYAPETDGSKGFLWYVDLTLYSEDVGWHDDGCVECFIRPNVSAFSPIMTGIQYLYVDGEWQQAPFIQDIGVPRVPAGFKGWIYTPYTSYPTLNGTLYSESFKSLTFYCNQTKYLPDAYMILDEVLFVG